MIIPNKDINNKIVRNISCINAIILFGEKIILANKLLMVLLTISLFKNINEYPHINPKIFLFILSSIIIKNSPL